MQRTLAVRHELPSLSPVEQALKAIGMQAVRMDQASAEQTAKLSIARWIAPTEETLIRNKLGTVAGVADLDFNLMQRTLSVRHADGFCQTCSWHCKRLDSRRRSWTRPWSHLHPPSPVTTPTNWWPLGISHRCIGGRAVYWLHNGNHWSVVILAFVAVFTGASPPTRRAGSRSEP